MTTARTHAPGDLELPQVFGRYLLVRLLSRGGMGEIFLAKHGLSGFEKLCVIKKVLAHLSEDEHFISRFVDEAQVAIQLQHNNIAQVFEVGRVGDEYFLAIEYVEGRDLRRILRVLRKREQRLPLPLALFAARELANGLSYAHRRTDTGGASLDLVHCDISPPNVVMSFEGEVKIIDFGIAKSALRVTATDPKIGFGKFGYMAPEQLVRGGVVDHRTDIYSTGVILYEVLTGKRLYKVGKTPDYRALARKVTRGEHDLPSDHDPALAPLDPIVARALAPKPTARYQTAAELRDDIQRAMVKIDPTMSSEKLGSFLRGLYVDELTEERRLAAAAQATDLAPWQAQLTSQASDTISFALAENSVGALAGRAAPSGASPPPPPRTTRGTIPPPIPPAARAASDRGSPSVRVDPHVASGSHPVHRSGEPAAVPTRRRGILIGGALALGLSAVVGAAIVASGERSDSAAVAAVARQDAGADAAPDAAPAPIVQAIADARPAQATPDAAARAPSPRVVAPRPTRRERKTRPRPRPKKQDALTRGEVGAKFKAVSREYSKFKRRFGKRLESRWADLANDALYAGSDPEALREVSGKIDGFRAAMRKIERE